MVAATLLLGCGLSALTATALFLNGLPAANALGIYLVASMIGLLITTNRAAAGGDRRHATARR